MNKIAITHPGKIGDMLYTLPTIRALCNKHAALSDFYTSIVCQPVIEFLAMQSCIDNIIIPNNYVIEHDRLGVQPWKIPIENTLQYAATYHLGFRENPKIPLPEYIAEIAGLDRSIGKNIYYELSNDLHPLAKNLCNYYVVAPKVINKGKSNYHKIFKDFITASPLPVIEVGSKGEALDEGYNLTGLPISEMARIIECSQGFIGLLSSPLVIANGYAIRKVVLCDERANMQHIVSSVNTAYMINPKIKDILSWLSTKA